MDKMSYKTFVWPQNPTVYQEKFTREPKYVDGSYDSMGPQRLTISGKGVFYGAGAFDAYKRMTALFVEGTPGNLKHPVWGIRYCYFTGLELTQEPRENYVSYAFTFTLAQSDGTVPK